MIRKPPVTRADMSGWFGHRSTRLKSLAVVGALTLGVAGAALAAAVPASADPAFNFIQIGSDTTENVMDFFAVNVGGGILASYDAVTPVSQTPGQLIEPAIIGAGGTQLNCEYTRPNGSGQGFKSLVYADTFGTAGFPGTTVDNTGLNTQPGPGCISLSRSSSGPGSVSGTTGAMGSKDATGNLVYIPFAIDAVTYATGPIASKVAAFSYTATMASPAVFTATGSSYALGDTVELSGTVPGGFTAGTLYFVVNPSGATFELASTEGGTPINSTTAVTTGGTVQFFTTTQCVAATTGCINVGTNGNPAGIGNITFTPSATNISQTLNLSQAQLTTLYGTCASVTVGTTTLNPVGQSFAFTATNASPSVFTATGSAFAAGQLVTIGGGTLSAPFTAGTSYFVVNPSGATFSLALTAGGAAIGTTATTGTFTGTVDTPGNIDLYVPQNGSGTLSFWESTVGSAGTLQPCWHQTIVAGNAAGIQVEEHDGSAIASDPNGIAPNSIAKWIGMTNGFVFPDVRHGSTLQSVTNATGTVVAPINSGGSMNISGCLATGGTPSACFPITREVFNVMDFYEVVSGSTPPAGTLNNAAFNPVLAGLFSGAGSALCGSNFTIAQLGFGNMPSSNSAFPDTCGSTASTLRVQMNGTAAQG
jgi:hypothetical protein